ncbi:MAG TPA: riboflavin biosynthesis protein RibD, partial [Rhodospirillaceae bacterium]|nr:riboflavin biosynthesis protein RibD [Rhodospirillaceae bacterium]
AHSWILNRDGSVVGWFKELSPHFGLLAAEGITRVLVEGGAKINTSFLKSGLCDYFLHFRSPKHIGDAGVPALEGYGLTDLGRFGFGKANTVSLGEDLLEIYTRRP